MGPGSGRQATGSRDRDGRNLHARLLRCAPSASSDRAGWYLDGLITSLRRYVLRGRVDDALLVTVAIEVIPDCGERPEQYDPDRLSLSPYLLLAAKRDLLNALQRERWRADQQIALDNVELRAPARNRAWASMADPADTLDDAPASERVAMMREKYEGRDREIAEPVRDGVRRPRIFADVRGLQDRPVEEQVREVKRAKDRPKKRLPRLGRRTFDDG